MTECRRHDAQLYSTFDDDRGSLADPGDNEKTYRSWAESLDMAERFGIPVLYIFSNQIEPVGGVEHVRRMSGDYSEGEQYANLPHFRHLPPAARLRRTAVIAGNIFRSDLRRSHRRCAHPP